MLRLAASSLVASAAISCSSPTLSSSASPRSASFGSPLLCSMRLQSFDNVGSPVGSETNSTNVASAAASAAPSAKRRGRPPKQQQPVMMMAPPAEAVMPSVDLNTMPPSNGTGQLIQPPVPQEGEAAALINTKKRRGRRPKKSVTDIATPVVEAQPLMPMPPLDMSAGTTAPPAAAAMAAGLEEEDSNNEGDALSFFSGMADDGGARRGTSLSDNSTLIYNALTGRMNSEFSTSVQCLKEVGFGVNAQRQLYVENPVMLNNLAERIRDGSASMPTRWPSTLTRSLGALLANKAISDPAVAVQQMMQVKINSITRSRYASVVSAAQSDPTQLEVSDRLNIMDDETDPSRAIELNEEQERVIDLALQGHHLYLGGSAGTGKTVLLRVLCRRLQAHRLRVAMTATTGVAGCHIGGSTFHHALGVSAGGEFLRRSAILDYDVIIIDEVSMFPQRLFEDFDRVLREEAGTPDLPFGGVQIILCGDFLQLGCINESSIIHSKLFMDNFVSMRLLTQVRQSAHQKFAADLQLMRLGLVPGDLTTTIEQLPPGTMVESAVNLLPTNKEVHAANEKEMTRLEGDPLTLLPENGITALKCETTATLLLRTKPDFNEEEFSKHVRGLLQATLDLPRASLLSLYRVYEDGHVMRVMLPPGESVAWREAMRERFLEIAGLINDLDLGATVTEISPNGDGLHTPDNEEYLQKLMAKHPIAQPLTFKKGCRVLLRSNLSSNLVNGSIGTVIDFVECKRESFPEYLRNENVDECIERYRVFCFTECGMPIPMVPVVKFHSGETLAVPPWEFTVGGGPSTNYYSLSAVALPLTLAYAFTVHKVQGLTLVGRVHLELSRMWPCEHLLYVAMSRVRNPEQLSMSSFKPTMVVADPDCVAFDTRVKAVLDLTPEDTSKFPVSSWKRCNDTIYHLRRRGASLRRLLVGAAVGGGGNGGNASSHSSSNNINSSTSHELAVEQSVLVARRMRKLVKHVERVAKLSEARKKAKATASATAVAGEAAAVAMAEVIVSSSMDVSDVHTSEVSSHDEEIHEFTF